MITRKLLNCFGNVRFVSENNLSKGWDGKGKGKVKGKAKGKARKGKARKGKRNEKRKG